MEKLPPKLIIMVYVGSSIPKPLQKLAFLLNMQNFIGIDPISYDISSDDIFTVLQIKEDFSYLKEKAIIKNLLSNFVDHSIEFVFFDDYFKNTDSGTTRYPSISELVGVKLPDNSVNLSWYRANPDALAFDLLHKVGIPYLGNVHNLLYSYLIYLKSDIV